MNDVRMGVLLVRFTRLSNERHRFEATRPDGGVEMRELETRSFLLHDLVHFSVESAAGLKGGFYGQLARGAGYEDPATPGEGMQVEMVVAPLQGATRGEVEPEAFVAGLRAHFSAVGHEAPAWLTPDMIERALEILRGLRGRWRATPFGEAMELSFEV